MPITDLGLTTTYIYNKYTFDLLGNIYQGFLQYLSTQVYPEFKSSVIETYYKAVEMWTQNQITSLPPRPSLHVDPSSPIAIDTAGMQLWRLPIAGVLQNYLYNSMYTGKNYKIKPFFVRYRTQINAVMWFQSIYQHLDMQIRLLQVFNGANRWCKPYAVHFYSPLPKIVLEKGEVLDWGEVAVPMIYSVTGKPVYAYPIYVCPMLQLVSLTDETTRDEMSLPGNKLGALFEIQMEIPVAFNLESIYKPEIIKFEIETVKSASSGPVWTTKSVPNIIPQTNTTMSNYTSLICEPDLLNMAYGANTSSDNTTTITTPLQDNNDEVVWQKWTDEPNSIWMVFEIPDEFIIGDIYVMKIMNYDSSKEYVVLPSSQNGDYSWYIQNGILYLSGNIVVPKTLFTLFGYIKN